MAPIWKETIGNVDDFPYVKETVQILSQDDVTVTFTVNQLVMTEGTPMMAVHYRDVNENGDEVCDMNASGKDLIALNSAQEYTAHCTYGYADIGVYSYVGPHDEFNKEECEACKAPDNNYVGYYISVPCVPLCQPTIPPEETATEPPTVPSSSSSSTSEPTDAPTVAPTTKEPTETPTLAPTAEPTNEPTVALTKESTETPTTAAPTTTAPTTSPTFHPTIITEPPPIVTNGADDDDATDDTFLLPFCPDDITLVVTNGVTEWPTTKNKPPVVEILRQETSTVTVGLNQEWTSGQQSIDAIFYSYKESIWSEKCYEEQEVVGKALFDTITIHCNILSPYAHLHICVVDEAEKGILSATTVPSGGGDDATIPKCCHSEESILPNTPTVCYSIEIRCDSLCVEEDSRKLLRGRGSK